MPRRDAAPPTSRMAGILTILLFLALLAGQFGFSRIGLENPFLIPERLVGALSIFWLSVTFSGFARSRTSRPGGATPLTVHARTVYAVAPLLVLVTSAFWSPPGADIVPVVVDLVCMVLYSLSFVVLFAWDPTRVVASLMWCLWIAGAVFAVAGLAGAGSGRVSAFGGGPNVYSRVTDLGLVGLAWLISTGRVPAWALMSAPLMLAATVASGSRGGMLAAIVCLLVLLPLVKGLSVANLVLAGAVALAGSVVVFRRFGDIVTETARGRVVELTIEQGYTSGRGELLTTALQMFESRPLVGHGLRSFETTFGNGFTYPHNLVAQVAAEAGIVGLLPLGAFLAVFFGGAWRFSSSVTVRSMTAAALVIFTSSMFSGDYYDARFLWIFGLGIVAAAWQSRYGDVPEERVPSAPAGPRVRH